MAHKHKRKSKPTKPVEELYCLHIDKNLPESVKEDLLILTHKAQIEINTLLEIHKKPQTKQKKTKAKKLNLKKIKSILSPKDIIKQIPIRNKAGNHIIQTKEQPSPSPYLVNLRPKKAKKVSRNKKAVVQKDIEIIVFSKEDLETQFTTAYNPEIWVKKSNVQKRLNLYRTSLIGVCSVIILFFSFQTFNYYQLFTYGQDQVLTKTEQAFKSLNKGYESMKSMDFDSANNEFSIATREFIEAEKILNNINPIILKTVYSIPSSFNSIGQEFKSGHQALLAGSRLSLSAKYFAQGLAKATTNDTFSEKVIAAQKASQQALPHIKVAQVYLDNVETQFIPIEKRDIFIKLKENLPLVEDGITNFTYLADLLIETLGHEEKKRYLVPFQNTAELRSTGGFIGSFAIVDIFQGNITNIDIPGGGSYDLQGGLRKNIRPPRPLQLISERWEFQDSNWFADFPSSAKMMEKLYTLSWGSSVDGIIAINLPVIEQLINTLGPVELTRYNKVLTGENFWQEIQQEVEIDYDKEKNQPKEIIADLAPIVLEHVLNSEPKDIINIIALVNQGLIEKNILIHMKNKKSQDIVTSYGWGGEIRHTPSDYLAIFNNNIAGGKTDRVIRQNIHHKIQLQQNGETLNTVIITREHTGIKNEAFTGVRNVSYIKAYVPKGSKLISATGFDKPDQKYFKIPIKGATIDEDLTEIQGKVTIHEQSGTRINNEFEKTVFGNWSMVDPGHTVTLTFTYKTPIIIKNDQNKNILASIAHAQSDYSLLVQKQPGMVTSLTTEITLPNQQPIYKKTIELTKDEFFSVDL